MINIVSLNTTCLLLEGLKLFQLHHPNFHFIFFFFFEQLLFASLIVHGQAYSLCVYKKHPWFSHPIKSKKSSRPCRFNVLVLIFCFFVQLPQNCIFYKLAFMDELFLFFLLFEITDEKLGHFLKQNCNGITNIYIYYAWIRNKWLL